MAPAARVMHSITVVLFLGFVAFFLPILLKLGIGLTILAVLHRVSEKPGNAQLNQVLGMHCTGFLTALLSLTDAA